MGQEILVMKDIYKSFNTVNVLKSVSLRVEKGEVMALLGENGAGKSTLMNILCGVYSKDSGTIVFNGEKIEKSNVNLARKKGIAIVHQELNLFPNLTVWENVFLKKEITAFLGVVKKKEMIEQTQKLFDEMGLAIDVETYVSKLTTAEKQMIEIGKALYEDARLIILDEPTTALNTKEISHLFEIIRKLKKEGRSFIFISHKLNEIFDIADSYTVFRNGECVSSGKISNTTPIALTRMMVGENYDEQDTRQQRKLGECVLEIKNATGDGFNDVSLDIKKSEIAVLTGLMGSGVSELMQTVYGNRKLYSGDIKVKGKSIKNWGIKRAMRRGIGMVSANRKENSVIPNMSVLENEYISEHTLSAKRQIINTKKELEKYREYAQALKIKAHSPSQHITLLSGGNQQKVILARCLNTGADIILLDNPTQGIDLGAKSEIYRLIEKLATEGKTVIVNTSETAEIQKLADVCHVFAKGMLVKTLEREEISEERIMEYATLAHVGSTHKPKT